MSSDTTPTHRRRTNKSPERASTPSEYKVGDVAGDAVTGQSSGSCVIPVISRHLPGWTAVPPGIQPSSIVALASTQLFSVTTANASGCRQLLSELPTPCSGPQRVYQCGTNP